MQTLEAPLANRKIRGLMLIFALIAGAASLSLGGCSCTGAGGQEIQCPQDVWG